MTNRWKNFSLWAAIFAFAPILLDSFGATNFIPHNYEVLVHSILAILVIAGIINNPTTNNRFLKDDK